MAVSFPSDLACYVSDSYIEKFPKRKNYLGGNTLTSEHCTIELTLVFKNRFDFSSFYDWWRVDINYGQDEFWITLPFFKDSATELVRMSNNFNSKIVDDGITETTLSLIFTEPEV